MKPKRVMGEIEKMVRCPWCLGNPLYIEYHDQEWGVPLYDDRKLFEFLVLEGAQAGLSWLTVLKKRDAYRRAYAGFDPKKIARFGEKDKARLLSDGGIIRNRQKIEASINNARRFLDVQEAFGSFSEYMWRFVDGHTIQNRWTAIGEIPAKSKESEMLSRDLIERGFRFVGPTIIYAHMQATGMVNDHLVDCFRYNQLI